MFTYQRKINEKDALVFNKGGQKEDNAEVLALVEGDEGKLELVNGLLSDDEILQSVGDAKAYFTLSETDPLNDYLINNTMEESHIGQGKFEDAWFNSNFYFYYNNDVCNEAIMELKEETSPGGGTLFVLYIELHFKDDLVTTQFVEDLEVETIEVVCNDFQCNGEVVEVELYTKNLPIPSTE